MSSNIREVFCLFDFSVCFSVLLGFNLPMIRNMDQGVQNNISLTLQPAHCSQHIELLSFKNAVDPSKIMHNYEKSSQFKFVDY